MTCRRCHHQSDLFFLGSRSAQRQARPVGVGEQGYCADCAIKRQSELRRSDERAQQAEFAEATKANAREDDCAIIAIATATSNTYRITMAAARKLGYRPGKVGMNTLMCSELAVRMAARKGRSIEHFAQVDGARSTFNPRFLARTPASVAAQASRQDRLIIIAMSGRKAHAMSVTDGELHNANSEWRQASVSYAWRVV